jgi:hypothetical protein
MAYFSITLLQIGSASMKEDEDDNIAASPQQKSEVARILAQIQTEYEAARQGLSGLSQGTSRHSFITAHMENMGNLHTELQTLVGDQAMMLITTKLDEAADHTQDQTSS